MEGKAQEYKLNISSLINSLFSWISEINITILNAGFIQSPNYLLIYHAISYRADSTRPR